MSVSRCLDLSEGRDVQLNKKAKKLQEQIKGPEIQQQSAQQYQQFVPQQAQQDSGGPVAAQAEVSIAQKSKGLEPAYVRKQLMSLVKEVMSTDEELELDSPFMEAGMDSLSSVALMAQVAKEFSMSLSPSLVFDFPTVRALEEHLISESQSA